MAENEFVITRTFNASKELMFKVWSELEHFKKWWGPTGFELESSKLDFRPGGVFHYCMRAPEGFEMWGKFVYHEIVAPEKIVFVNSFSDPEGNIAPAPFPGNFPLEIQNTLTLIENDGKTTLTLRGGPINASDEELSFYSGMFEGMNQGFKGTFDQLEAYLATV